MLFINIFFISLFIYHFSFNKYHLAFQEQIQLFRFSVDYFREYLAYPGGLLDYAGAFFTQFFQFPFVAALILTSAGIMIFILTCKVPAAPGIAAEVISLFAVLIFTALHSSYLYSFSNTLGFIASLVYFLFSLKASSAKWEYILIAIWPVMYLITGSYAFLAGIMMLIHLLSGRNKLNQAFLLLILCIVTPVAAGQAVYLTGNRQLWTGSFPLHMGKPFIQAFLVLAAYFPVVLLLSKLWKSKAGFTTSGKRLIILPPVYILVLLLSATSIMKLFYERETELLLGMDHHVQGSEWNEVLQISGNIKDPNRMVLHYTNLALFKTGSLGDKLFHYPQSGKNGLWLDWEQDWLSAFFGSRTIFDLGYNSEAYRWAYEAMVARGPNPRSLKILILTSIVDDNFNLARKYLAILDQSLFYRKWASQYRAYTENPEEINDPEIIGKKKLLIRTDFINSVNPGGRLTHILREHPGNLMAYEYQMASFLLEKDLDGFTAGMKDFRSFGRKEIPAHYQEALAAYRSYSAADPVPEGYAISKPVMDNLQKYARAVYSHGPSSPLAAEKMSREFGNTYWYYMKFVDSEKPLY